MPHLPTVFRPVPGEPQETPKTAPQTHPEAQTAEEPPEGVQTPPEASQEVKTGRQPIPRRRTLNKTKIMGKISVHSDVNPHQVARDLGL